MQIDARFDSSVRYCGTSLATNAVLAMCATALAILGFIRATTRGDVPGRVTWVLGAVGLVYAHYVEALALAGLVVAYMVLPSLRRRYRPRDFCIDAAAIAIWVAPLIPQVIALSERREGLAWVASPSTGCRATSCGTRAPDNQK